MRERPSPRTRSWPPELARRVEAACARFEEACKSALPPSGGPRIEDYLVGFAKAERPLAVAELVGLDLVYRIGRGQQPSMEDYASRFPEHADLIQLAFEALSESFPLTSPLPPASVPPTRDGPHGTLSCGAHWGSLLPEAWPTVPGFELVGLLGRGGMGVVFQAWQQRPRRLVALKMMRNSTLTEPDQLGRFRLEAETMAQLHHPNIVQVYEVGDHEGQPFFSMEFIEGGSLAHKLRGTPLRPRAAAELTETLARAVHAAHQRGIVHRDLKPSNVLLTSEGLAKITDFGLAKRTFAIGAPVGEDVETQTGALLGTPSYMAPEQARGYPEQIGPATDVYALGAILYELLAGRPPFKAATQVQTVFQVVHEEPVPPKRLQKRVPHDLETICLKCLQKRPARRYETAAALADDLHHFLAGETISARPASAFERTAKWARRRPATAAVITLGAVAIVGLLGITLWFNAKLRKDVADARDDVREAMHREQVQQRRAEIQRERLDAADAIAAGRYSEATKTLDRVFYRIKGDTALVDLVQEVATQLKEAAVAATRADAQERATRHHRDFLYRCDEAVFRAALPDDGEAGDRAQAITEATNEAFDVFRLKPEEAGRLELVLGPEYTKEQRDDILPAARGLLLVLADAGKPDEAAHALEQARDLPRSKVVEFCLIGQERLRLGDDRAAIEAVDQALRERPGYTWAHYLLGVAHSRTGNADAAFAHLNACLSARPKCPVLYLVRGSTHGSSKRSDHTEADAQERFELAEADFRKALDLASPADTWTRYGVLVNRGAMRVRRHDLAGGIADLEAAKRLQKQRAPAYFNLAQAYRERGHVALVRCIGFPMFGVMAAPAFVEEAIRSLRQAGKELDNALEFNKQQAELHRLRARLHRDLGEPRAALQALKTAIRLSGSAVAEDHAETGRILIELGEYRKACEAFQLALVRPNPSPTLYLGLADAHWMIAERESDGVRKRNQYEAAVEALSRYLRSPDGPRAASRTYGLRGLLRVKLSEHADAIGDLGHALEREPDAGLYAIRGWTYLALNESRKAALDFEAALKLDADHGDALRGRGLVRVKKAASLPEIRQGVDDVERSLRIESKDRSPYYDSARVYAQAARRSVLLELRSQISESYERAALALLREAIGKTDPGAQWAFWREQVLKDPELEPLHRSRGFRDLHGKLVSTRPES